MKYKVDHYEVYSQRRRYRILKFPRIENAWAFDDALEENQLILFYYSIRKASSNV